MPFDNWTRAVASAYTYVAVRSYRRSPSPNSLPILAMNAMRICTPPSRIVTSPARDSGLLHSICCALRYMAKSPVTRKWGYPSFSATATNFIKVVYMVERSVGGACKKGRYLIVVTVLSDVMALKPLHSGMVCATLLAKLPSSHINSLSLPFAMTALSTTNREAAGMGGGSGICCDLAFRCRGSSVYSVTSNAYFPVLGMLSSSLRAPHLW